MKSIEVGKLLAWCVPMCGFLGCTAPAVPADRGHGRFGTRGALIDTLNFFRPQQYHIYMPLLKKTWNTQWVPNFQILGIHEKYGIPCRAAPFLSLYRYMKPLEMPRGGTGTLGSKIYRIRLFLAKGSDGSYRGRELEQLELFPFYVGLFPISPFLANPYYTKMNNTRIKFLFFVLFL